MNTFFDIKTWIDSVITYWKNKGIELEDGASELQIGMAEKVLGIQFPSTFKGLYREVNGFKANDWNEHMISIWPIERMLEKHSYNRYANFVGFSDYLISSHVFGFLKEGAGIYKFYDVADIGMPIKIAESFPQAIDLINTNSELLY